MYELHDLYPNKKFFSVENPIENPLPFATQLEVNIPIDRNKDNLMDFSDFNRSLFRRD
jgi:type II secretory ATPase GspE/PulE/Tfp pilus assembly ATPase PilB-like protein